MSGQLNSLELLIFLTLPALIIVNNEDLLDIFLLDGPKWFILDDNLFLTRQSNNKA